MRSSILRDELCAARARMPDGSTKKAVLDRFQVAYEALVHDETSGTVPERTRAKITAFLDHLQAARDKLQGRFFQPSWLLNVTGDAMARADLVSRHVVEVVQVGLYFFGLDQIEKRWSARAAVYSGIHADYLQEYLGRDGLKSLIVVARERMAQGKVFCLTWNYLNGLRKAYWKHCRRSEDALDVAVMADQSVDELRETVVATSIGTDAPADRVGLMLDIFKRALTSRQQWIYLAKNRAALANPEATNVFDDLVRGVSSDFGGLADGDLGWTEISERLGINEKTAKREYLKGLHALLQQSAEAIFGLGSIPSAYVRRILEALRAVVHEKDLRLKDTTGRGLGILVEKWEVALRFVLNHPRVSA